MRLFYNFFIK